MREASRTVLQRLWTPKAHVAIITQRVLGGYTVTCRCLGQAVRYGVRSDVRVLG